MAHSTPDTYDNKQRLRWNERKFSNSDKVSEPNKKAIRKFIDKCYAEGLSDARVKKYITNFHTIFKLAQDDFRIDDAEKSEIERVVATIERSEYSEATKSDFKIAIQKYYKVMEGNGESFPDKVGFINTNVDKSKVDEPDPLSRDKIKDIISEAQNKRDRAMYSLLYFAGLRSGELMSLQLQDLTWESRGVRIKVDGKTGTRQILVVGCKAELKEWVEEGHPMKDVRSAPLWTKLNARTDQSTDEVKLGYNHMRLNLKRLSKKAGVRIYYEENGDGEKEKKTEVYPYLFRHSRATHIAGGDTKSGRSMTESSMKTYFGWTMSSSMPEIYIHLSGRDMDEQVLALHGLDEEDGGGSRKPQTNFCPNCGSELPT